MSSPSRSHTDTLQGIENLRGYTRCLADGCVRSEMRGKHFNAHVDSIQDNVSALLADLQRTQDHLKSVDDELIEAKAQWADAVAERDSLRADLQRLEGQRDLYKQALYNIAKGYWNVGREVDLSTREYAASVLRLDSDV